ncbi:helix-turn-helix domain-containing protein [Glycomyces sp. TRM65418]|uniref:helix-turn-helix domain-containing protein n=1 Tax=Glycomyces sp. TRM65418 TaxID=2867006 RepID=UPI001CE6399C|nr:helix-turn-helix domain-containing protein [Glycomyces sp. TRM65418]MCC3762593.1 helix-turn-helix domain-containing protein [Glycomyces sp. TRM65418]QZD56632.1 helix-turn-helix domain-containing protein [Glycomyces sp. TRM65418]
MALVCGTCGTELHDGSPCVACRASGGQPLDLPGTSASRITILPWLRPDAQAALATGHLSRILTAWRKITGATQAEVANDLGYTDSYISQIEHSRRDITNVGERRRIAEYLGIAPHVLGVTDQEDADYRGMLAFGESTLRLAGIARNAGRPAAALNELWPLVLRLEDRVQRGHVEPAMISLLARARSALGVYLGDILPVQALSISAQWTGRALQLTEHLADADLHAQALRSHGNELRKAGDLDGAVRRLRQSAAIAGDGMRPTVLVALARAAADAGADDLFDTTVTDAQQLAAIAAPSPLFNEEIVAEVRLRGLLHLGRRSEAANALWRQSERAPNSAPQWQAIALITTCEALAATGETADAARLLPEAITAARACRLPQQIQRVIRVATGVRGLEDIAEEGRHTLHELAGPDRPSPASPATRALEGTTP